jgi:nicotinate-nucleotide adenylyltransferase
MKPPIGLLGGTFDPVHHGHLRLALEARTNLDLAEVRLVPAAEPPHRETPQAALHHRRAMLELAIAGVPGLRLDAREIERPGKSYTFDTVASLRAELPYQPLCLLIGRDAFLALHTWRRWRELPELVHIVIVDRPGAAAVIEDRDLAEIYASRRADDPAALHAAPAGRIYRGQDLPRRVALAGHLRFPRPRVARRGRRHTLPGPGRGHSIHTATATLQRSP